MRWGRIVIDYGGRIRRQLRHTYGVRDTVGDDGWVLLMGPQLFRIFYAECGWDHRPIQLIKRPVRMVPWLNDMEWAWIQTVK